MFQLLGEELGVWLTTQLPDWELSTCVGRTYIPESAPSSQLLILLYKASACP